MFRFFFSIVILRVNVFTEASQLQDLFSEKLHFCPDLHHFLPTCIDAIWLLAHPVWRVSPVAFHNLLWLLPLWTVLYQLQTWSPRCLVLSHHLWPLKSMVPNTVPAPPPPLIWSAKLLQQVPSPPETTSWSNTAWLWSRSGHSKKRP